MTNLECVAARVNRYPLSVTRRTKTNNRNPITFSEAATLTFDPGHPHSGVIWLPRFIPNLRTIQCLLSYRTHKVYLFTRRPAGELTLQGPVSLLSTYLGLLWDLIICFEKKRKRKKAASHPKAFLENINDKKKRPEWWKALKNWLCNQYCACWWRGIFWQRNDWVHDTEKYATGTLGINLEPKRDRNLTNYARPAKVLDIWCHLRWIFVHSRGRQARNNVRYNPHNLRT